MARIKCLQRRIYDILSNKFLILFVILFLICFIIAFHLLELYVLIDVNHSNHCRGKCCDNIGSICQPCEPIDAVYTWVNGSDPILLQQMRKYSVLEGIRGEDDLAPSRYDDKQELKYSLRSLELYAPWIRRVYVVTAGQIPWWLDVHEEHLVLISHEDIIPKHLLPTFSSPAIESFLHKIPGLSERFLYLNDDIFLGGPLHLSDLYTPTSGYEVYTAWNVPDCSQGCPWSFLGDSSCDNACDNAECDFDGGDCTGDQKNRHYGPGDNFDYLGEYADNPFFDEDDEKNPYGEGKDNFERYPGLEEAAVVPNVLQARQLQDQELLNNLLENKEKVRGRQGRKIAFYDDSDQQMNKNIKLTKIDLTKSNFNKYIPYVKENKQAGVYTKDEPRINTKDFHDENHSNIRNNQLVRQNKQKYDDDRQIGLFGRKHIYAGRFGRKLNVFNNFEDNIEETTVVNKDPNSEELKKINRAKEHDKLKLMLAGSAVVSEESYTPSESENDDGNNSTSSSDVKINHLDIGKKITASIGKFFKKPTTKAPTHHHHHKHKVHHKENKSKITMRNIKSVQPIGKKAKEEYLKTHASTTPSNNITINVDLNNESLINDTTKGFSVNFDAAVRFKNEILKPKAVHKKIKSDLILKLVKASQDVDLNVSNVVQKFNQNVIKTDKKIRKKNKKYHNEGILNPDEKGAARDTRKLDVYARSLIHTNKIFNRVYGFHNRKVPAHVPFLLEKKVIEAMQTKFKDEFEVTVRNKFRRPNDFQFAFSYYHYLMGETKELTMEDIFDQFDTDKSGTWSDREVRTVLTRTRGLPLTAEAVHSLETAAKACEREEHKNFPTPPNERYLDSDMPTLSKSLVIDCPTLKTQLMAALSLNSNNIAGRPRPAVGRAAFAMLSSNVTKAVAALDEIRRETKMFICINDNLDPVREEENIIARMLLQELYESLLPLPSKFELPVGVANRFLRVSELKTWQDGRRVAWQVLTVCASLLSLLSLYHMKCCRRTVRRIKSII